MIDPPSCWLIVVSTAQRPPDLVASMCPALPIGVACIDDQLPLIVLKFDVGVDDAAVDECQFVVRDADEASAGDDVVDVGQHGAVALPAIPLPALLAPARSCPPVSVVLRRRGS